MSKKTVFLTVIAVFFSVSQSFAVSKSFVTTESTKHSSNPYQSGLTPEERLRQNEQKVEENPGLRSRWGKKSHEPASEGSLQNDNLADKVLTAFREDEELSKIPAKLKVNSSKGVVTLSGFVNNPEERTLIEEKVGQMEGVKKIINHLKIKTSNQDLLD